MGDKQGRGAGKPKVFTSLKHGWILLHLISQRSNKGWQPRKDRAHTHTLTKTSLTQLNTQGHTHTHKWQKDSACGGVRDVCVCVCAKFWGPSPKCNLMVTLKTNQSSLYSRNKDQEWTSTLWHNCTQKLLSSFQENSSKGTVHTSALALERRLGFGEDKLWGEMKCNLHFYLNRSSQNFPLWQNTIGEVKQVQN